MSPDNYKVLPIPPLPPTQCLNTTTFTQPKLDGSLSVPELYDWHLEHSPNHPLFVFSDEQGIPTTIYWPEAARAVHRAGHLVRSLVHDDTSKTAQPSKPRVLAVLAATDSVTFFTLLVGVMRAGHTVFPISPRNSAQAVAHLLTKTGATHLFVGPEVAFQDLAAASLKVISSSGGSVPVLAAMPSFEELYVKDSAKNFVPLPPVKPEWDSAAVIMHSSGSTAFPKPIVWTHYRYLLLSIVPYLGERDLTSQRLACHSLPMYHGMGIMQTGWTASSGLVLTCFKPRSPAISPTPELVMKGAMDTKSDIIFCVPSFVEIWAQNPETVRFLTQIQGILYGGGPLSQIVGDGLTDKGVSIFNLYGCTEVGIVSPILPKIAGREWAYFKIPPSIKTHFIPDGNGNFELLVLPSKHLVPCVLNSSADGADAYASNDLLSPHPTKPGYWKVFGRADDQIMHNTGEKTNPGPLENILNQDPHIQAAVMFGRGRFNAGVLIDPRPASAFDPADQEKLVDFRNKIWPTVEKMNEFAPQHSRLFKEMIIVASPKKPFSYTAKNTARRLALINEYDAEIDALYAAVDESTQADLSPPSTWDLPSATTFVREVVNRVLKDSVGDNDDLFQKGCDSLQATWIRNSLLHALRDTTKLNTRTVTSSFVYQYSSINALASFLSRLASAGHEVISDNERVEAMLNMVEKYSTEFPTHTSSVSAPAQDVILLTGTTGGIGATLLGLLAASPEVSRVYALNRRNQQPLNKRQHAVFKDRGIDVTLLDSHKVVLIETDLGGDKLGLPLELWEEIRTSVTHIIHNAWPVNFNLSLKSFEPAVKTVRDLIDLSLASPLPKPPQFVFISSVGVLRHLEPGVPVKEGPVDASVATGLGYSESKWVAEKLLSTASNITPLQSVSIRVGQVTGGASGAWNSTEWFPSLVRTSVSLGCLPTLHKEVSWISAVATAETILEMRNSSVANLHLAHPRPVSWSTIMEPIAQHLALNLVPYDEWFAQLEKKSSGLGADAEVEMLRQFPAAKILDFFSHEKSNSISVEAMGIPRLDVSEAQRISTTLQKLPPLTGDDALRWVAYWKQAGLL